MAYRIEKSNGATMTLEHMASDESNGKPMGYPKRSGCLGFVDTLYPPGQTGSLGERTKNHWKKFWWCELAVFLAGTLLITLILVFVAFPSIAQQQFNKSTLTVVGEEVSNPTPSSFDVVLTSVAQSNSTYHPTLSGFEAGIRLLNRPVSQPMFNLNVPPTAVLHNTIEVVNQTVQILDMEQFEEYNMLVMNSSTFSVGFYGKPQLHEEKYPTTTVTYNKEITMAGLNNLKGINITQFQILLKPLADGSNAVGQLMIPNPTVYTLPLGNTTYNLSVNGQPIGTSFVPDLVLKPGNNTVNMNSNTNQEIVLSLIQKNYTNGILPLTIEGVNSTYNGQLIPYFTAAIKSSPLHVDLNLGPALQAVGLNITKG